jgi:hypothetical protein
MTKSVFEWSTEKAGELNASHSGQWTGFLDVFTWVLNGWATKPEGAWIATDKGAALTEDEFAEGVENADAITWK